MAKIYTLKGEAGKRMDETVRDWEVLRCERARLELAGLDGDRLTWSASLKGPHLTGVILPEESQGVELFQSGTRIFRGHCAAVTHRHSRRGRSQRDEADIEIVGPDWWLERITLTDGLAEDQAENTAERAIVRYDSATLKTNIGLLLARAVALGAPISSDDSGLVEGYELPRLSFSSANCFSALIELLKWVPDAMFWWDYSGALPVARLERRGTASTVSFALGTAPLVDIDLRKRIDWEVEQVVIPYAQRDEQGRVTWQEQSSGTASEPLKRQMVTVSGPELDTFLPIDLVDSVDLKTVPLSSSWDFIKARDAKVQEAGEPTLSLGLANFTFRDTETAAQPGSTTTTKTIPATSAIGNNAEDVAGMYLLEKGTVLDWLRRQEELDSFDGTISGFAFLNFLKTQHSVSGDTTYDEPDFVEELGMTVFHSGWTGPDNAAQRRIVYVYPFTIPATFVSEEWATETTVYRAPEYDFIFPPEGLADDLKAAQNFVPWEGRVRMEDSSELLPSSVQGRKMQITGGFSEWSTMQALIQAVDLELATGEARLSIGVPVRLSARSLADKFSQSGQDNIVPLS